MSNERKLKLSASLMNTASDCFWYYYVRYILRLPEKSNTGASRGTICHAVLDFLTEEKNRDFYHKILRDGKGWKCKPVDKMILEGHQKFGLTSAEDHQMIREMILVGLQNDFLDEGGRIISTEKKFVLETDRYVLSGIVDRITEYPDYVKVKDYKTSKMKPSGSEKTGNLQGMTYSFIVRQQLKRKPKMEFVFLRFPKNPIISLDFSDKQLDGYEKYITYFYGLLSDFSEKKAKTNFAFDNFAKRWKCGSMIEGKWRCPFRSEFIYFALVDSKGNTIKTSFNEKELVPKEGESVIKKKYHGCPRFKKMFD